MGGCLLGHFLLQFCYVYALFMIPHFSLVFRRSAHSNSSQRQRSRVNSETSWTAIFYSLHLFGGPGAVEEPWIEEGHGRLGDEWTRLGIMIWLP
jgi:hypothetical protein